MRLWHEDLISKLPRQQLLGQHRECCALRGAGWGKKHATVDYVFEYSPFKLFQYHTKVMDEMISRGYKPNDLWSDPHYRGTNTPPYKHVQPIPKTRPLYTEHNPEYYQECITNLQSKNIEIY